ANARVLPYWRNCTKLCCVRVWLLWLCCLWLWFLWMTRKQYDSRGMWRAMGYNVHSFSYGFVASRNWLSWTLRAVGEFSQPRVQFLHNNELHIRVLLSNYFDNTK